MNRLYGAYYLFITVLRCEGRQQEHVQHGKPEMRACSARKPCDDPAPLGGGGFVDFLLAVVCCGSHETKHVPFCGPCGRDATRRAPGCEMFAVVHEVIVPSSKTWPLRRSSGRQVQSKGGIKLHAKVMLQKVSAIKGNNRMRRGSRRVYNFWVLAAEHNGGSLASARGPTGKVVGLHFWMNLFIY